MIYLDNAATTFPKPEAVRRAVRRCIGEWCGNPGRSGHRLSVAAAAAIYACREAIADLFGGEPENVVFTLNATYALNLAVRVFSRPGGEILISGLEHNAVLRPVAARRDCSYAVFDGIGGDEAVLQSLRGRMTARTSLVVCSHVSNVCGITLPVERIGALCRERGIRFVIDASQSAGIRPLDLRRCQADAICAPGHKGLYGIQGSGFLLFSRENGERAAYLPEFISGGTGVSSLQLTMPEALPERYEAGTLPTPAVAGLRAGIAEIRRLGVAGIGERERALGEELKEKLLNIPGITVYAAERQGGTVLFNLDGIPSERVAEQLDARGFCLRGGFHCSPLAHRALGTGENGAVRASFSIFSRRREISALASALSSIRRETGRPADSSSREASPHDPE